MKHPALLYLLLCFGFSACAQESHETVAAYRARYRSEMHAIIGNDTAYLRFFPASEKYAVEATVERLENEPVFRMTTSSGKAREARRYALLRFTLDGKDCRLYAYQLTDVAAKPGAENHLFLPFRDRSSGRESYSGGRYLDLETGDIRNGKVAIDFNKAYNPYCAFRSGYQCPVPPRENTLDVYIRAGEQYRAGKFKH